jgi:hypothetical protein
VLDVKTMKDMICESCDKPVSFNMAQVSHNRFRKILCIEDQKKEIERTYPPSLKEFALKQLEKFSHV